MQNPTIPNSERNSSRIPRGNFLGFLKESFCDSKRNSFWIPSGIFLRFRKESLRNFKRNVDSERNSSRILRGMLPGFKEASFPLSKSKISLIPKGNSCEIRRWNSTFFRDSEKYHSGIPRGILPGFREKFFRDSKRNPSRFQEESFQDSKRNPSRIPRGIF